MSRPGLPGEVPTLELCREMAAAPVLMEAFKDSTVLWENIGMHAPRVVLRTLSSFQHNSIPAPTVREMLAFIFAQRPRVPMLFVADRKHLNGVRLMLAVNERETYYRITDPDDLAKACIEAAKP
jgi:hypothetical protein